MTAPCLPARIKHQPLSFVPPPGSCDSHAHVFGPYDRFPLAEDRSYTPQPYPAASFIEHLDTLGMDRGVLVTGSASGSANEIILDALQQYPDRLRGVIVPSADMTDRDLDRYTEAGVRGVRANLYRLEGKAVYRNGVGLEVLQALAPRLAERGWHAQIWIHAPDLPAMMPALSALNLPLVVDHMGRMNTSRGVMDPGFQFLCSQLAEGRLWTKISGADRNTTEGPPYADVDPFARAILQANDEQVVWGTDWPHINYYDEDRMPDDGELCNLLNRWLSAEQRRRILVDNPARLYGFSA
ncbi:amidohydrolase [Bordetella sp. 15P40C-2]|uniref:amidohydrolase family protein n=1 Tax=Bordetella sp. 15P40C-2 TaxID=2572246 RepID=UPI001327CA44|nr:amidohydrolase family protein [Bordetella sp. 15P40C-2]MVW72841.1 amidohydrolase family protein [Bordetella sp. 15P40C-2]